MQRRDRVRKGDLAPALFQPRAFDARAPSPRGIGRRQIRRAQYRGGGTDPQRGFRERDQVERSADERHLGECNAERDLEGRDGRGTRQDCTRAKQILGERNDLVTTRREILHDDADPGLGSSERMAARPVERRGNLVAGRRGDDARCFGVKIGQALEPLHVPAGRAQRREHSLLLGRELEEAGEDGRARVSAEMAPERDQRVRQRRQIAAAKRAQPGSVGLGPTRKNRGIVGVVRIAAPCPPALAAGAPLVDQRPCVGRQRSSPARIEQRHALVVRLDKAAPLQRRLRRREEQCGIGHCIGRHGLGPQRFEPLRIGQDRWRRPRRQATRTLREIEVAMEETRETPIGRDDHRALGERGKKRRIHGRNGSRRVRGPDNAMHLALAAIPPAR